MSLLFSHVWGSINEWDMFHNEKDDGKCQPCHNENSANTGVQRPNSSQQKKRSSSSTSSASKMLAAGLVASILLLATTCSHAFSPLPNYNRHNQRALLSHKWKYLGDENYEQVLSGTVLVDACAGNFWRSTQSFFGGCGAACFPSFYSLVFYFTFFVALVWCGPCKLIEGTLITAADKWSEKLEIVKYNVEDDHPNLKMELALQSALPTSLPSLILFQDCKVAGIWNGVITEDELDEFLVDQLAGVSHVPGERVPGVVSLVNGEVDDYMLSSP